MENKKKKLVFWIILVGFMIVFGVGLVFRAFSPVSPAGEGNSVVFLVNKGENLWQISSDLQKAGLIKSKAAFWVAGVFEGKSEKMQAGYYLLDPSAGVFDILEKISSGNFFKKQAVLLEGWTLDDIGNYLEKQNICSKEYFRNAASVDFSVKFDFLKDKPKNLNLEGYIFPDTYDVSFPDGGVDLISRALVNFNSKLTPEMKEAITKQKKTIFEIITMASIIEKEVNNLKDKKIVSGILWKRLAAGMPLQVDATVSYGLGIAGQKISIDDTKTDSPYNTYSTAGLPKGPISNPGIDSILAAIYPVKTSYWFYLSAPSGKTIFSATFGEHLAAKAKYLK